MYKGASNSTPDAIFTLESELILSCGLSFIPNQHSNRGRSNNAYVDAADGRSNVVSVLFGYRSNE